MRVTLPNHGGVMCLKVTLILVTGDNCSTSVKVVFYYLLCYLQIQGPKKTEIEPDLNHFKSSIISFKILIVPFPAFKSVLYHTVYPSCASKINLSEPMFHKITNIDVIEHKSLTEIIFYIGAST